MTLFHFNKFEYDHYYQKSLNMITLYAFDFNTNHNYNIS